MSESDADPNPYPVEAPGWAALDRILGALHPGPTPHQFTSETGYDLDSPHPLPAISVFEGGRSAEPYWHYVTYGLTELFEKSSPQADVSGFGFELAFALPRGVGEPQPPRWPLRMLQGLGGYVLQGHGTFDSGHIVDLGGLLAHDDETADGASRLEGLVAVPDPRVGKVQTIHGSVLLLLLCGLTRSELELMQSWPLERKVGLMREVEPMGITRVDRLPFAEDPRTEAAWRRYALGVLAGET